MNSVVRIVKKGRNEGLRSLPIGQDEKTHRQSNREIISTVKSWIAELEQRRRASEQACRRLQAGGEGGV
jgi:hypothetical protein